MLVGFQLTVWKGEETVKITRQREGANFRGFQKVAYSTQRKQYVKRQSDSNTWSG